MQETIRFKTQYQNSKQKTMVFIGEKTNKKTNNNTPKEHRTQTLFFLPNNQNETNINKNTRGTKRTVITSEKKQKKGNNKKTTLISSKKLKKKCKQTEKPPHNQGIMCSIQNTTTNTQNNNVNIPYPPKQRARP